MQEALGLCLRLEGKEAALCLQTQLAPEESAHLLTWPQDGS